jgi:choline dehydrogenase-like flavoprotein
MIARSKDRDLVYDLVIIGSGMGGGTLAYALRNSGLRIALLERGDFLPKERENWDAEAVFGQGRYKSGETWLDSCGKEFSSAMHYFVGGSTKVYGAALVRLRKEDFGNVQHAEGISPAWPIQYEELEPYYNSAEKLFLVHGAPSGDPFGPPRSEALPFPPLEHEPYILDLQRRLENLGLKPGYLPLGVDRRTNGSCIRCATCDGFPCLVDAKADAERCCVSPALKNGRVDLYTNVQIRRLVTNTAGDRIIRAEGTSRDAAFSVEASTFVVSCGAINSAALLLRSKNAAHPSGIGNSANLVGRNYMVHLNSAVLAVHATRRNPTIFQKTMVLNDFYFRGGERYQFPLGSLQLLGKSQTAMLKTASALLPGWLARIIANHSVDWWATSEDLPDLENRVSVTEDDRIQVFWKPKNLTAHEGLLKTAREVLKKLGYHAVFVQRMGIGANSHQCGTVRFGADPSSSVLDPHCRSHDVPNLYVVDGSFFPSSAAVNPALTIAAQALRVADHIASSHGMAPELLRQEPSATSVPRASNVAANQS